MKVLSILIPSHHYPEGVNNILHQLSRAPNSEVEILIGDDSINDDVKRVADEFIALCPGLVTYIRNIPPLGAVNNWNSLLSNATGKYILLMHHDEFPISKDWIVQLLRKLGSENCPDIIFMPCIIFKNFKTKIRVHIPRFIQKFTIQYYPSYLFRRNLIGPMSCLVIKKKIFPRFDENLRWLVDVDMYWRLLSIKKNIYIDRDLKIGSISNRKNSITRSLAGEIIQIRKSELSYLNKKHPNSSSWLAPDDHPFLFFFEDIFWVLFKGIYLIYSYLLRLLNKW